MRKAKIVATIGPATESPVKLRQLIRAGVDVVRLNFSHGCHETYHRVIREVRRLSCKLGKPVAILQDLQGPKVRTGQLKNGGPVQLKAGRSLTITTRPIAGDHRAISTSYAALPSDVKAGDSILLSDGLIKLRVISTSRTEIRCGIVRGGDLAQNQGINIPGVVTSAPALTRKDLRDLEFGITNKLTTLLFLSSAQPTTCWS